MAMTIVQLQAEQATFEADPEYQFEQRLLELDERLDKLRVTFARIHADDKEFSRFVRKANRFNALCPACQQSKLQRGGASTGK